MHINVFIIISQVQEQLLLKSLQSFSNIIESKQGNLSWSNPAECEAYIKTLQESAEMLSGKYYIILIDIVFIMITIYYLYLHTYYS